MGDFHWDDFEFENTVIGAAEVERRPVKILKKGSRYEGDWKPGTFVKHGRGVFVYPDSKMYEGYFVNDKRHGKGRFFYKNGDVYVG